MTPRTRLCRIVSTGVTAVSLAAGWGCAQARAAHESHAPATAVDGQPVSATITFDDIRRNSAWPESGEPREPRPDDTGRDPAHADPPAHQGSTSAPAAEDAWTVRRVGGDLAAKTKRDGDIYRFQSCAITTPLPAGYPDPTPPGAIELKKYPQVRRAEIQGSMNPDLGMNFAFFPLVNHIKKRDIAMTSPVEMDYAGLKSDQPAKPKAWTMSFLYRTKDLGPAGPDPRNKKVAVVDRAPVTVVAIGIQGGYDFKLIQRHLTKLDEWLAAHPDWERAGEPRALYYNGPEKRDADKWAEAQIPVRFKQPAEPKPQENDPDKLIELKPGR